MERTFSKISFDGLKFRNIGISGKFRSIRPFLLEPVSPSPDSLRAGSSRGKKEEEERGRRTCPHQFEFWIGTSTFSLSSPSFMPCEEPARRLSQEIELNMAASGFWCLYRVFRMFPAKRAKLSRKFKTWKDGMTGTHRRECSALNPCPREKVILHPKLKLNFFNTYTVQEPILNFGLFCVLEPRTVARKKSIPTLYGHWLGGGHCFL